MWIYIAVTVSLFVAFTNFIVLALICSLRRLQTLRNVPLAGLATADILVGLCWIPLATASSYLPENKGLCRAALSCEILTMHASLFNLIAVSTERWIAIFKPLHYHQIASKTVVLSLIALSWILSFAMLIAYLLADKHDDHINECDIVKYIDIWLLYVILVIFYLVCGIMILMQMKVYFIVREQIRKVRPTTMPGNVTNGLITATSFIIEKSFKIDESSVGDDEVGDADVKSANLSRQSTDCKEETGTCEGSSRTEVNKKEHADKSKPRGWKLENSCKNGRKKLKFSEEPFGSRGGGLDNPRQITENGISNEIGMNGEEKCFKNAAKISLGNENHSIGNDLMMFPKLEQKINGTSDSKDGEKIEQTDVKVGEMFRSTRRYTDQIDGENCRAIIENGFGASNGDIIHNHYEDYMNGRGRRVRTRVSGRKKVYYSPDQDNLGQKGTAKKSFASFVRLFSVIKTQNKLEYARAAATNIVCLCFVLMWAPKSTIDLLTGLGYCDNCSMAHSISAVLAWMNSGINALIYAWRMHEFRGAIRAKIFRKKKRMVHDKTW